MAYRTYAEPARPSTWLFGEAGGMQVWVVAGDNRVRVSVLVGQGAPVVLLNQAIVGTPFEYESISWAFGKVAEEVDGFHVWVA